MFRTIQAIRSWVDRTHPKGHLPYGLESIRQAITEVTNVDRIEFIEVDTVPGALKGMYKRYERSFGVYSGPETAVEVYHRKDLNFCWTRFVVCKEMCHSLEDDSAVRVNSTAQLIQLAESLTLSEGARERLSSFLPFVSERTAEIAAIELLCPLHERKRIAELREHDRITDEELAREYRIPLEYARLAFTQPYIQLIEMLFEEFGHSGTVKLRPISGGRAD